MGALGHVQASRSARAVPGPDPQKKKILAVSIEGWIKGFMCFAFEHQVLSQLGQGRRRVFQG